MNEEELELSTIYIIGKEIDRCYYFEFLFLFSKKKKKKKKKIAKVTLVLVGVVNGNDDVVMRVLELCVVMEADTDVKVSRREASIVDWELSLGERVPILSDWEKDKDDIDEVGGLVDGVEEERGVDEDGDDSDDDGGDDAGVTDAGDGFGVGEGDGWGDGCGVEDGEGCGVGDGVGDGEGCGVGDGVGDGVGWGVGDGVGLGVGDGVGDGVGLGVLNKTKFGFVEQTNFLKKTKIEMMNKELRIWSWWCSWIIQFRIKTTNKHRRKNN